MFIHINAMRTSGPVTKERIDRTALQLFVERGIAETSIKEIAEAAGVSQGAMYNHYESKDQLAWTLFASSFSEIGAEFRYRAYANKTLDGQILAIVKYCFEQFDKDRMTLTYVFFARHSFLKKYTPELGNHPYMVMRTIVSEAMRRKEIPRSDPEVAASMVIGAITQVIDTKILGRIKTRLSGLSTRVAKACVQMLKG